MRFDIDPDAAAERYEQRRADRPSKDGRFHPLFIELGRLMMTRGIAALVEAGTLDILPLLTRHRFCDWGDLDAEDIAANDTASVTRARILSAYRVTDTLRVWIITEADRSATAVLLPDEY